MAPAPSSTNANLASLLDQLAGAVAALGTLASTGRLGGAGSIAGAIGGARTVAPRGGAATAPPMAPAGAASAPDAARPSAPPLARDRARGTYRLGNLTPSQVGEATNKRDGKSACGPAAAVALARFLGKEPSLDDTIEKARKVGWTRKRGMAGPASEAKLLDSMGIGNRLEMGVDWEKVKRTVQSGKPVIVNTPGHYWVVEGYDPATGKFDFGESGLATKAKKRWLSPDELAKPGKGAPRATIYLD